MNIISEDADYVGQTGTLVSMYPGYSYRSRSCTSITINEDDIVEYNEVFNVILTESSQKLTIPYGRNITQITIREDNDCKYIFTASIILLQYTIILW